MSFSSDSSLLSLIGNQSNEEAKSLIRQGNLYNAVDTSNNTLLHYAAEYGNPDIVQFLIDSGSDVNAQNTLEQTPLIMSLKSHLPCKQVIELLLVAGGDVDAEDLDGNCVLDIINSCEWLSADARRYEIMKVILEYEDFDLYLFVIWRCGTEEIIRKLLDTNIDICKPHVEGVTIVHVLTENSNPGVIELLHGRNFDVNKRNAEGWTPLMFAASYGNASSVEFLLNEGADIEATSKHFKETALYVAMHYGILRNNNKKVVQVLLEHNANVQVQTAHNRNPTIFDLISKCRGLAELSLAHLALQEALGTTITDLVRKKINADRRFKAYFEECKQQLSIEICPSITLFDLLTASKRKKEGYLRNQQLVSKLMEFQITSIDYFNRILRRRVSKVARMVGLRKTGAEYICSMMKMNYDSYPFIADGIVSYLDEKDIECLILINNDDNQ